MKGDLPLMLVHAKCDHIQFGFFGGALLSDAKKVLKGSGKFLRHIPVKRVEDIDEAGFATMIRRAVKAPSYR